MASKLGRMFTTKRVQEEDGRRGGGEGGLKKKLC